MVCNLLISEHTFIRQSLMLTVKVNRKVKHLNKKYVRVRKNLKPTPKKKC